MRKSLRWGMALWIGVLLVPGCKAQSPSPAEPGTSGATKESGPVLARVDGEVIGVTQFQEEIDALPEYTRKRMNTKQQKLKQLEKMIDEMLLLREADRRGLDRDAELLRKVDRYRNRLITEKLYQAVAQEQSDLSEKDIETYYEENKARFAQQERIRARQILILVPPKASPEKVAEAKAKADEALRRAKAGEDFAELAKQFSEGPAASRGGDLGYFSKGRMVPEFEEIAFTLKDVGEISDVVRTKFGFHIIQLTGKQPAKQLSLDEVRERIVRQLESNKRREIRQSLAKQLREKATVEIHEELLSDDPVSDE